MPEGIAKRHTQDDGDERQIEQDERDMRLARFGYMFTFDRQHFWDEIGEVPHDLRKNLVHFGLSYPRSSCELQPMRPQEFERLFFHDPRTANAWQEHYSDEGDSDLLALLRLLRRAAAT